MYRYYSVARPVSIGTFPKKGMKDFENFEDRTFIESIGREAWGVLYYSELIPEDVAESYELVLAR